MLEMNDRALVVEDDPSWREILAEILTDSGLAVDAAGSLEAAASAIRARAHRLAVVDLSLGVKDPHNQDGLHVLDALRIHDPGCAAILLTGYATVELAVSAVTEYGAITCLRKESFRRAQFREIVQHTLASAPPAAEEHPASPPAHGGPEQTTNPGRAPQMPAGLALVVEDDAGWRSILAELLAVRGFQVRLCHSFGEALGCLRREKYILAVVDLSLAGSFASIGEAWRGRPAGRPLEGYRLLASTRAAGIPTLVVSGIANPADIERTYSEYGVFAFIQKQAFNREVFLQTVQEALSIAPAGAGPDGLTDREREVLDLLAQGMTNKEIAEALVISTNTVKRHLKAIFEKLEVHTRSGAAARALGRNPGETS
ncbi:MAG TPA: response regulator [Anaerolineales bacterium]